MEKYPSNPFGEIFSNSVSRGLFGLKFVSVDRGEASREVFNAYTKSLEEALEILEEKLYDGGLIPCVLVMISKHKDPMGATRDTNLIEKVREMLLHRIDDDLPIFASGTGSHKKLCKLLDIKYELSPASMAMGKFACFHKVWGLFFDIQCDNEITPKDDELLKRNGLYDLYKLHGGIKSEKLFDLIHSLSEVIRKAGYNPIYELDRENDRLNKV